MQTTLFESTALSRIGYDDLHRRLVVEFRDRTTYLYRDVPPDIFAALLRSDSKGRYLNTAIRGRFLHAQLNTTSRTR
jgi:hypothetical protein